MREQEVGGIEFQNVLLIYHEYVNYQTTKFRCLMFCFHPKLEKLYR